MHDLCITFLTLLNIHIYFECVSFMNRIKTLLEDIYAIDPNSTYSYQIVEHTKYQ